ncbi:hypothetical protein ACYSNR_05615 [Enterococcus sp. LJL128]
MKKIKLIACIVGTVLLLAACGTGSDKSKESSEANMSDHSTNDKTAEQSDETSASSNIQGTQSVFTGVLTTGAAETDGTVRITLTSVEAVEDPETILPMMESDGVILNAGENQLAEGLTLNELQEGDKIRFTLTGLPIMTMSIPPQIPGNSIKQIEKV